MRNMKAMSAMLMIGALALVAPLARKLVAQQRDGNDEHAERPIVHRLAGSGSWQGRMANADARWKEGSGRPWFIHAIERDDGSVRAKLSVPGVPGFDDLTVEGQLDGDDAFGVLLNEKGVQVGTFNAKMARDGNGGTFILGSGESGSWSYDMNTGNEIRKAADSGIAGREE
ncbi:hypothetical protein KF840_07125 [bacterium]|nr:hypothetical protein [bacterium]